MVTIISHNGKESTKCTLKFEANFFELFLEIFTILINILEQNRNVGRTTKALK